GSRRKPTEHSNGHDSLILSLHALKKLFVVNRNSRILHITVDDRLSRFRLEVPDRRLRPVVGANVLVKAARQAAYGPPRAKVSPAETACAHTAENQSGIENNHPTTSGR